MKKEIKIRIERQRKVGKKRGRQGSRVDELEEEKLKR